MARRINKPPFFPLPRQHVSSFIRVRMNMRGDGGAGGKLAQDGDATGLLVLVQHHQFNSRIRAGLPFLVRLQSDVWKHGFIQDGCGKIAIIFPLAASPPAVKHFPCCCFVKKSRRIGCPKFWPTCPLFWLTTPISSGRRQPPHSIWKNTVTFMAAWKNSMPLPSKNSSIFNWFYLF